MGKSVSMIKLDHGLQRIEIKDVIIENAMAFAYFDKLPEDERDGAFTRAFNIGVLALEQDRVSTFLAITTNDLGPELESLKLRLDNETELYYRSSSKGADGENKVLKYLTELAGSKGFKDVIAETTKIPGNISKNKTGDILSTLEGKDERKIAIEVKFDKGLHKGEFEKRDWYAGNPDTAISQLIESKANRDADQAIIVFDRSSISSALIKSVQNVRFISGVGFIAVIDSRSNNFDNLGSAYLVARDLAVANQKVDVDSDLLLLIIEKLLADLEQIAGIQGLVERSIATSRDILSRLKKGQLSIEFSREYLLKFLAEKTLSKLDLLEFYTGGDVKRKYASIESDLAKLWK